VHWLLHTGCRYGELVQLRVSDFNEDAGTIRIGTSKSGRGRSVVLSESGITFFRTPAAGCSGDGLLLPKQDGSAWGKSHQARPIAEAREAAAIKPAASFHVLRHTYASHAVMNGMQLMVLARNLGHTDTRMVEKHYGHLADSFVRDAVRKHAPQLTIDGRPMLSRCI
jgi:integrase